MNIDMTKQYEPKFYTTDRDGKIALWVVMPNGVKQNIWTIEKKCATEDVLKSIMSAYLLGMDASISLINTSCRVTRTTNGLNFEHIEGEDTL